MPTAPNERWRMDFVADRLGSGRRYRILTMVDDFTRECRWLESDFSLSGERHHGAAGSARLHYGRQRPRVCFPRARQLGIQQESPAKLDPVRQAY